MRMFTGEQRSRLPLPLPLPHAGYKIVKKKKLSAPVHASFYAWLSHVYLRFASKDERNDDHS